MKKWLGLALFLLAIYLLLLLADPGARSAYNHVNLGRRIGLYGIISLGASILIITGGIDLSIGSTIGLCATVMAMLLVDYHVNPLLAIVAVLALGAAIGLANGLLVTKLRVQAFVVTLCGLFIYRGAARWLSRDQVKGLGTGYESLKYWLSDSRDILGLPMSLVIFLGFAALATVFLHRSVYGRYMFAVGSNEQAARYSGIAVDRYRILAYVLCSTLAALFSILFLMEQNSVQPTETGSFFELYAIAGAVLGGCSLRGGEGSVLGVIMGTAILWILPNFTKMWGVPSELEYTVIGAALLIGALVDEGLRRGAKK
ncbi:MAG TPA: ABC transporter permease [Pirellulales bacterium]|nr:ABC transporter permease [Pirellulales bacterium]